MVTWSGFPPVGKLTRGAWAPRPSPITMERLFAFEFGTATSPRPSPFISATATAEGYVPIGVSTRTPRLNWAWDVAGIRTPTEHAHETISAGRRGAKRETRLRGVTADLRQFPARAGVVERDLPDGGMREGPGSHRRHKRKVDGRGEGGVTRRGWPGGSRCRSSPWARAGCGRRRPGPPVMPA